MPELSNIVDSPYSSVGDCEKQWLDLMNNKAFDEFDISDEPKSYMVNSKWGSLIEKGAKTSNSWYAYLPLWSAAIFLFMYSVGRIFALICAKFKDMQNIVDIGLNICFWITPVFWRLAQNASFPVSIIKYTPVAVFVNGYRSVLLYGTFDIKALIYIICIDALIFIIGSPMQKRIISNIADGL